MKWLLCFILTATCKFSISQNSLTLLFSKHYSFVHETISCFKSSLMRKFSLFHILACVLATNIFSQTIPAKHDPKADPNLSPSFNQHINPELNAAINPKLNWNINPHYNASINPDSNATINPQKNKDINPNKNKMLNPMYHNDLHPQNPGWKGLYVFNKDNDLHGFVSSAGQHVILYFDSKYKWIGYLIKSGKTTYNFFNLSDQWTGQFGCYDGILGFNFFEKDGEWRGVHVK